MLYGTLKRYLEDCDIQELKEAAQLLSSRYRGSFEGTHAHSPALKKAYLATRMPATFEAACAVFKDAFRRGCAPKTLLDVGSGPGTAAWAALECFEILEFTLLEKDAQFIQIAQNLLREIPKKFHWERHSLENYNPAPHDLVVFSYSLGELAKGILPQVMQTYWNATQETLIIIEPGTPKGFETILEARKALIKEGARIIAPCPHQETCSLRRDPKDFSDWCHFSARVERTFWHREAKEGRLPYEDEKFSYIIASKAALKPTRERILRPPLKRSGHIHFTLCREDGLKNIIVTKKESELYKSAKKLDWGDDLQ